MGLRGPVKKNGAVRRRRGGEADANDDVIAAPVDVYAIPVRVELLPEDAPQWFNARMKNIWDEQLRHAPQLRRCDALLYADYCLLSAELERLQQAISAKGYVQQHANKTVGKRSEAVLAADLRRQLLKVAHVLGFSPYARKQQGINLKPKSVEPVRTESDAASIINSRRMPLPILVPPRPRSMGSEP